MKRYDLKVKLLSAQTGKGHYFPLKAVQESFKQHGVLVETYPSFYEDLDISNQIISDFYNIVHLRSAKLSAVLSEVMALEGKQKQDRLYQCYYEGIERLYSSPCDIIISFTPLLNRYLIRYQQEHLLDYPRFFIVITDPYKPIYPGFDIEGASLYFCPNCIVKQQLLESGIHPEKIVISGYPLQQKFLHKCGDLDSLKKRLGIQKEITILINCGAFGDLSFVSLIQQMIQQIVIDCHYIIICGTNKTLYAILKNSLCHLIPKRVILLQFVNNLEEWLSISRFCVTKGGANSVYECLATDTLPLITSFDGLMYQEKGVYDFLKSYGLDYRFDCVESMIQFINEHAYEIFFEKESLTISKNSLVNGAEQIVNRVLADFGFETERNEIK